MKTPTEIQQQALEIAYRVMREAAHNWRQFQCVAAEENSISEETESMLIEQVEMCRIAADTLRSAFPRLAGLDTELAQRFEETT